MDDRITLAAAALREALSPLPTRKSDASCDDFDSYAECLDETEDEELCAECGFDVEMSRICTRTWIRRSICACSDCTRLKARRRKADPCACTTCRAARAAPAPVARLQNTRVRELTLTRAPMNQFDFIKKHFAFQFFALMTKAAGDLCRDVVGIVWQPDTPDAAGDVIDRATVAKMEASFREAGGCIRLEHKGACRTDAALVGSEIVPEDTVRNGTHIKAGTWIATVRLFSRELQDAAARGELRGFSFGGQGERVPLGGEKSMTTNKSNGITTTITPRPRPTSTGFDPAKVNAPKQGPSKQDDFNSNPAPPPAPKPSAPTPTWPAADDMNAERSARAEAAQKAAEKAALEKAAADGTNLARAAMARVALGRPPRIQPNPEGPFDPIDQHREIERRQRAERWA